MDNVNKVLATGTTEELRQALKTAKDLAKEGSVIHLLDFLCPEDALKGVYGKKNKRRFG